jgi:hypothetical protein
MWDGHEFLGWLPSGVRDERAAPTVNSMAVVIPWGAGRLSEKLATDAESDQGQAGQVVARDQRGSSVRTAPACRQNYRSSQTSVNRIRSIFWL